MRLTYGRDEVNHLDVFRIRGDRGDRTLMGMFFGALIGGGIGYLMSRACTGSADSCALSLLAVPAGGILGGIFGGVAGFLTGYTWQPVSTHASTR